MTLEIAARAQAENKFVTVDMILDEFVKVLVPWFVSPENELTASLPGEALASCLEKTLPDVKAWCRPKIERALEAWKTPESEHVN